MLWIDFFFVWICNLKIIRKPIFFLTTTAIQTRTLALQSSPLVTQTSLHYYRWRMNPPEVENAKYLTTKYLTTASCSIVNNRCTGEVGRARKKLKEMPENFRYRTPSDGLHACCAFVFHNEKKNSISMKIFPSYPASRVVSDLIRNLFAFDLTAMSRVKQTTLSSSGEKKNSSI